MHRTWCSTVAVLVMLGGACTSGTDESAGSDRPTVVVTTSILGDVVENLVGGDVDVVTVMPVGASPHDFQASAKQANQIREADALILNGGGFEAGLVDVAASAEGDGVPTFAALDAVEPLDGDPRDPHFFTDPSRMAEAVDSMADFLVDSVSSIDESDLRTRTSEYRNALLGLDADISDLLDTIPAERRVMVTNHEVFSYFADRYDFEIVGTVIPGASTSGAASAGDLAALAELIVDRHVPAIFADTSSPNRLARTLADEVGDIEVVELFSESLGAADSGGETYLTMTRTNAERTAAALGASA